MLKFNAVSGNIFKLKGDCLVLYYYEQEKLSGLLLELNTLLNGRLQENITENRFLGKEKETLVFDGNTKIFSAKVIIVGLGEKKRFTIDKARLAIATALKTANKLKLETVLSVLPEITNTDKNQTAYALLEGAFLAAYKFKGIHKSDQEKETEKKELKLFILVDDSAEKLKKIFKKGYLLQKAVNQAKDLINLPANTVTPSYLEKTAREIAGNNSKVKLKVLSFNEAKKLGMGGFCAVAQGSAEPARFIVMEYKGGGKEIFGLVGKGITFDSGGISLKPAGGMGEMKTDMSGAATVLCAFQALTELGVKKNIVCLVPATENMPDGRAYKPADVIKMYNGKTVEINSTDAEGRMILADALTYAQELGATRIIDYATLTGACQVALGQTRAGVMTNSQSFLHEYLEASEYSGEKHWQLPMDEEYADLIKSETADTLNNSEKRYAGTISGAKFLEKFVEAETEWIHCDIAGTAYLEKPQRYIDKNATGFGIRTLIEFFTRE